jgi:hypothetical protein
MASELGRISGNAGLYYLVNVSELMLIAQLAEAGKSWYQKRLTNQSAAPDSSLVSLLLSLRDPSSTTEGS